MSAVKSKGTQIEIVLGKALWSAGLRYRKNVRKIFGAPDFVLSKYRIAVFADSEFWHGKDWPIRRNDHRTNVEFWHQKIETNIERDILVNRTLKRLGWTVLRFWGNDIKTAPGQCVAAVMKAIEDKGQLIVTPSYPPTSVNPTVK